MGAEGMIFNWQYQVTYIFGVAIWLKLKLKEMGFHKILELEFSIIYTQYVVYQ